MVNEITDILHQISNGIKTDGIVRTLQNIPTDIKYFKPLFEYSINHHIDMSVILFLYVQSNAPFSVSQFIGNNENKTLLKSVYISKNEVTKGYIAAIMANLLRTEFKNIKCLKSFRNILSDIVRSNHTQQDCAFEPINCNSDSLELARNDYESNYEKNILSDEFFYTILLNLSKTNKNSHLQSIRLEREDSISILRLKAKIMSNYVHSDIISNLVAFMNVSNTILGFSLSKAIYKIILRSQDQNMIIKQLMTMADNIFAKEFYFINTAQIFAFLVLRGIKINVEDIILKMINYDNAVVYNNEQVRETGLLLLWACIRAEAKLISIEVLHELILISLFDCSLNCRRAATSVLSEYLGRNRIDNTDEILRLINFDTVKRIEGSYKSIIEIMRIKPEIKQKVNKLCKQNLIRYKLIEQRYIYAQILKFNGKCFCTSELDHKDVFNHIFGLCVYFNISTFCEKCQNDKRILIIHNLDIKRMQSHKHFDSFLKVYLLTIKIIYEHLRIYNDKNVVYCLDKNIYPEEVSKIAMMIKNDRFKEIVYKNFLRKQNDAYILSNANNTNYYQNIANAYLKILQGDDTIKKSIVIKALQIFINYGKKPVTTVKAMMHNIDQYTKHNINYISIIEKYNTQDKLVFYILLGLEDYSVYVKGDAGYFVRRNAIITIADKYTDIAFRYFIKYFVDKSANLRKDVFCLIKHFENSDFVKVYTKECNLLRSENKLSDEHIHFQSAFLAFDTLSDSLKKEFMIGILATYKNSDSYTIGFIQGFLFLDFSKYKGIVAEFLTYTGRYFYLTLYFIGAYVRSVREIENSIVEMLDTINLADKNEECCVIVNDIKNMCIKETNE